MNLLISLPLLLSSLFNFTNAPATHFDIVIYGGTSGGVIAAVQAGNLDKSVLLLEPGSRLGGLTSGGLGQTDIGNKAAIGGLSRTFYERIAQHYANPTAWKWQKREAYRDGGQTRTAEGEKAMWTFEPSVAKQVFETMVKQAGVKVVYGERLDRVNGVHMQGNRITAITMQSEKTFHGKMFIDATYEGDLMAAAEVSYHVGREANTTYGETYNGVQTKNATKHQLARGIDPYIEPGNPVSGLLPFIDPTGPGSEGSGDHRIQAYNFRMCLTDHPENRVPFTKPEGYNALWYELLFRNFDAGSTGTPWTNSAMPNRKTDINNRLGFSTDFIGQNYAYPEGDDATRARIVRQHQRYQQGLLWTLANHPRVPKRIRQEVGRWGLCKDEFPETNGWPSQLYVREARRMQSDYVMTQHDCQGRRKAADPVGLAAYTMDSHNTQRYVDTNGHVRNEGDVQIGGFPPYPISYRSIVPKQSECRNLLVPICLSASHIAYGSIRMEPVFMVLGQSAATAASLAIATGKPVQQVDYGLLRKQLLRDGQILEWKGSPQASKPVNRIDPASLQGIVIDDAAAELKGFNSESTSVGPLVGSSYRHDGNQDKGVCRASFIPTLPTAGRYEVRLAYSAHANRARNVPVEIHHAEGKSVRMINQQRKPPIDGLFVSLGTFSFAAGRMSKVVVENTETDGYVIIDAVQFIPTR